MSKAETGVHSKSSGHEKSGEKLLDRVSGHEVVGEKRRRHRYDTIAPTLSVVRSRERAAAPVEVSRSDQDGEFSSVMSHFGRHEGASEPRYPLYNSAIADYDVTFGNVLRKRYIRDLLHGRTDPVVLDLMAPSGTIADLFQQMPSTFVGQGIAVTLSDRRTDAEIDRDEFLGISQITGDLTTSVTWRNIKKELAGRKADLIMERGGKGLDELPQHPFFFHYALHKLWKDHLSENGGTMLIQFPRVAIRGLDMEQWQETLDEQNIENEFDLDNLGAGTLLLVKHPDSPAVLPVV